MSKLKKNKFMTNAQFQSFKLAKKQNSQIVDDAKFTFGKAAERRQKFNNNQFQSMKSEELNKMFINSF